MNDSVHNELMGVLDELHTACPEVRFAQLICNLSYLARGPAVESTWDVEDSELLSAAKRQLETLRLQHAQVG